MSGACRSMSCLDFERWSVTVNDASAGTRGRFRSLMLQVVHRIWNLKSAPWIFKNLTAHFCEIPELPEETQGFVSELSPCFFLMSFSFCAVIYLIISSAIQQIRFLTALNVGRISHHRPAWTMKMIHWIHHSSCFGKDWVCIEDCSLEPLHNFSFVIIVQCIWYLQLLRRSSSHLNSSNSI